MALGILCLGLSGADLWFHHLSRSKPGAVPTTLSFQEGHTITFEQKLAEVHADPRFEAALPGAIQSWESALYVKIASPVLKWGYCNENPAQAIACAQPDSNVITVTPGNCGMCDPKTILMHEIGHNLGVPHIQGDPLMNASSDGGVLNSPSPLAIVIASYQLQRAHGLHVSTSSALQASANEK